MNIILTDRADRLGANFTSKLAEFIYGKFNDCEIYHEEYIRYTESMITIPFFKLTKKYDKSKNLMLYYDEDWDATDIYRFTITNQLKNMLKIAFLKLTKKYDKSREIISFYDEDWRATNSKCVLAIKQDLISYFRANHKDKFLEIVSDVAKERSYNLEWDTHKKIICVHLRLGDVSDRKDYDSKITAEYSKQKINSGEVYRRCNYPDSIAPINEDKIEKLIQEIKKQNPDHDVHIVCTPEGNTNLKYPVHKHEDVDLAIWHMINSDILVLSRSSYALVAGYLHKGRQVYYPLWGHFVATGLYTKYDKSHWTPF